MNNPEQSWTVLGKNELLDIFFFELILIDLVELSCFLYDLSEYVLFLYDCVSQQFRLAWIAP